MNSRARLGLLVLLAGVGVLLFISGLVGIILCVVGAVLLYTGNKRKSAQSL